MDEHLIFFIDFVGFAAVVRAWDEEKMATLIALLHRLASLRSEFDFSEIPFEGGGKKFKVIPAITTFSDHIVMSYPTDQMRKLGGDYGIGTGLHLAQSLIGTLAAAAMSLGLLIRGGATVGPLYHAGGVVLGDAMNEAYELESRVSIYPRIVVSRKVYSQIRTPNSMLVLQDHDGITHFNYFTMMIAAAGDPPGGEYKRRLNAWLAEARRVIAEQIARLEEAERWNELAKWVWFRNHLEQARASFPSELLE